MENSLSTSERRTYDLMKKVAEQATQALRGCMVRPERNVTPEEIADPNSWWSKCCAVIIGVQVFLRLNIYASKKTKTKIPMFYASLGVVLLHDGVPKMHPQVCNSFINTYRLSHGIPLKNNTNSAWNNLKVEIGKDSTNQPFFKTLDNLFPSTIRFWETKTEVVTSTRRKQTHYTPEQSYEALKIWLETYSKLDFIPKSAPRVLNNLPPNNQVTTTSLRKTTYSTKTPSSKSPKSCKRKILDSSDSEEEDNKTQPPITTSKIQTCETASSPSIVDAVRSILKLPMVTAECKIQILRTLIESPLKRPKIDENRFSTD